MTNQLNDNIRQRIDELGLSPEAAAKKSNLDRGYFSKLFDGSIGSPTAKTLDKIADALETTVENLLINVSSEVVKRPKSDVRLDPTYVVPNKFDLPKDVEVKGTAAGSHLRGAFQFSGGTIEFVRRPPGLMGARNVYALYVEGSSMEPQYSQGDLVFVHPGRPPRAGDPVVIQTAVGHDDEIEATIGIFLKQTGTHVVIGKHNPKAEVQILRNGATKVHKIMTSNELYGV